MTTVLSRPRPSSAKTPEGFYGWRIVAYASLAVAATGPGQTAGVSLFVAPLIRDLDISLDRRCPPPT